MGACRRTWIVRVFSGLKNDTSGEYFALRHRTLDGEQLFACQFIKIGLCCVCVCVCRACKDAEPLAAYGTSFNYTLWYVRLVGEDCPTIVESVVRDFDAVSACSMINTFARVQYRYTQALRVCLRFMREQDSVPLRQACDELQRQTGVTLEDDHPLGVLRRTIVDAGDIGAAEALVISDVERTCITRHVCNVFQVVYSMSIYLVSRTWQRGRVCTPMVMAVAHPACVVAIRWCWTRRIVGHRSIETPIRVCAGLIYLFGGCDGTDDLADLWCYNLNTGEWSCLSENVEADGGPSARRFAHVSD
jgi:hypothetical protein